LLAGDGWRVVQRDLCGCGDSSGEFADATWSAWLADVDDELARCAPGLPVCLWAQRAGALLAAAACGKQPDVDLLLWQPVVSGATHLQQFLRLHAGARIVGSAKADDGPADAALARRQVRRGRWLCVEPGASCRSRARAAFDLPAQFRGRVAWFKEWLPTSRPG
jgi:alpha-beta hydrolase superfamily lysophospholipase